MLNLKNVSAFSLFQNKKILGYARVRKLGFKFQSPLTQALKMHLAVFEAYE